MLCVCVLAVSLLTRQTMVGGVTFVKSFSLKREAKHEKSIECAGRISQFQFKFLFQFVLFYKFSNLPREKNLKWHACQRSAHELGRNLFFHDAKWHCREQQWRLEKWHFLFLSSRLLCDTITVVIRVRDPRMCATHRQIKLYLNRVILNSTGSSPYRSGCWKGGVFAS